MTKEKFMGIFDGYFAHQNKQGKNKKGLFCAYCEYLRYQQKNGKCYATSWAEVNNCPDFGYATDEKNKTPLMQAKYYYDAIKKLCGGEDFLEFVPDWHTYVEPELEIVPPKKEKERPFEEFLAGVLIGIREIKLLIKENTNVQRNLLTELVAIREGMKK